MRGGRSPSADVLERVLLAVLLLEANRVVSCDRLVDAVWGDHPPETATNSLQVRISKLRRTLGASPGTGNPLHTQAPGYVLRTSRDELDSQRFEELATESNPDEGPATMSDRLAEALALWRGPVLDGIEVDGPGGAMSSASRNCGSRSSGVASRPIWPWVATPSWSVNSKHWSAPILCASSCTASSCWPFTDRDVRLTPLASTAAPVNSWPKRSASTPAPRSRNSSWLS